MNKLDRIISEEGQLDFRMNAGEDPSPVLPLKRPPPSSIYLTKSIKATQERSENISGNRNVFQIDLEVSSNSKPFQTTLAVPTATTDEAGPLTQFASANNGQVADAFCPQCGILISLEHLERQDHIQSCTKGLLEGDGSEAEWYFSEEEGDHLPIEAAQSSKVPQGGPSETAKSDIAVWLESIGVGKYADYFEKAGADLHLVSLLSDDDLRQMGVLALGARKKILIAGKYLNTKLRASSSGVGDWTSIGNDGAIDKYFPRVGSPSAQEEERPRSVSGSILDFIQRPAGAPPLLPNPGRSVTNTTQKRKKKDWVHTTVPTASKKFVHTTNGAAATRYRSWQLIPGTSFVVDRFCNLPAPAESQKHWFLTHFHADHYKGLSSKWNRGPIYCSPITATLAIQQLRVPEKYIVRVELDAPFQLEGITVTFIDANHCPGAVMIAFEPLDSPHLKRPVLHTGDARLVAAMQNNPVLRRLKEASDLYIDTTYCDPVYTFPPQSEVLQFALDAVKAEAFNERTLFLFGSYTIGKERLYLEAARLLNRKLYVSSTKLKVLKCLNLDSGVEGQLTTDDGATNLHAVPLWMVTQKHMAKLLKYYKNRFSTIVGFQPTGWTHAREKGQTKAKGRRRQKGTLITYQVPYSEHSSFTELTEFVRWFGPGKIVPTVNSDDEGPKSLSLVRLLRGG